MGFLGILGWYLAGAMTVLAVEVDVIVGIINNLTASLSGAVSNVSSTFSSFLPG